MVRERLEPAAFNKYMLTGEQFYCVPEEGTCGASVPLRKFYNFGDADSMLTAGSEVPPPMTSPMPAEVLCWIWPRDYRQDSTEYEVEEEQLQPVRLPEKTVKKHKKRPHTKKPAEKTNLITSTTTAAPASSEEESDLPEGSGSGQDPPQRITKPAPAPTRKPAQKPQKKPEETEKVLKFEES